MAMTDPWPVELRVAKDRKALVVAFDDGKGATLPSELLRCVSPSAEVQGHGPSERKLVPGKRDVAIASVEPVGNYAVRIAFDDGHSTGLYGWTLLAELSADPGTRLAAYRRELASAGLSHEP
jgi:DUF971 family protein